MKKNQVLSFIIFFCLVLSFSLVFLNVISQPFNIENNKINQQTSILPIDKKNKLSAEEENIDSFDVNPSGRWNITETGTVEDNITNSNLILESDSNSNYFANRGMTRSDSKSDFRFKSYLRNDTNDFQYFQQINVTSTGSIVVNFTLTNASGSSTGTTIYLNGNSLNNFNDIRFYDSSDNLLNAWFNRGNNKTWVKLASKTQIYIYYGSTTAGSYWDGCATFASTGSFCHFDDFESGSLNTSYWDTGTDPEVTSNSPYEGTYSMELDATALADWVQTTSFSATGDYQDTVDYVWFYDNAADTSISMVYSSSGGTLFNLGVYKTQSTTHYSYRKGGTWFTSSLARTTGWKQISVVYDETNNYVKGFIDGTLIHQFSEAGIVSYDGLGLGNFWADNSDYYFDAYFHASYKAVSPTFVYGSETESVDYIKLSGKTFEIGLYDQTDNIKLGALEQVFDNSSNFLFRVLLFDSNENIIAYYNSSMLTYSDVYWKGTLKWDILRSELEIEIKNDNETRFFKIDYVQDFTVNSSVFPNLFTHEISPDIYFESQELSLVFLDYIEAPFKEREWTQTDIPTNNPANWLGDSYAFVSCEPITSPSATCTDTSTWEITIPHLDSFSGSLINNITDNDYFNELEDYSQNITLNLYNVEKTTGDRNKIFGFDVSWYYEFSPSNTTTIGFYLYNESALHDSYELSFAHSLWTNQVDDKFPSELSFSTVLSNDRTSISVYGIPFFDGAGRKDLAINKDFSHFDDLSQEFVIEVSHIKSLRGFDIAVTRVNDFGFLERDIFQDIGNFFGNIWNGGDWVSGIVQQILNPLLEILAVIARYIVVSMLLGLLSPILVVINAAYTAINAAIALMGTELGQFIVTNLQPVIEALEPFIQGIEDWLDTNLSGIATLIWEGLSSFLADIIDDITGFINTIWTDWGIPLMTFGWNLLISLGQTLLDEAITWALNFLGLTALWTETGDFFDFLVGIVFTIFLFCVALFFGGGVFFSGDKSEVPQKYIEIWGFDVTFDQSILGFAIYLPFGLVMIVWIIIMGYASTVFPVVPW